MKLLSAVFLGILFNANVVMANIYNPPVGGGGGGSYTAGDGLSLDGTEFNIDSTVVTANFSGTVTANAFVGEGSGLTAISAGNITAGTLADARVTDALTISGGTINGSVIGGTTPAAGDFTTIDATGQATVGSLGINESSPDVSLHIEGDVLIDSFGQGDDSGIFFREGSTDSNKYNMSILAYDHSSSDVSSDGLSINAYDGVSFSTGSNDRSERMRIEMGGDIGIGTDDPEYHLHIKASDNSEVSQVIMNDDPSGDSDANLSIVARSSGEATLFMTNFNGTTYDAWNFAQYNGGFLVAYGAGASSAIQGANYTSNTDVKMRIEQNGNTGFGTVAPQNRMDISGGAVIGSSYAGIETAPSNGLLIQGGLGIGTESPDEKVEIAGGDLEISSISSGTGTSVVVDANGKILKDSSSLRYKSDVTPMDIDTSRVYDLTPVQYTRRSTGDVEFGFIAEDVYDILPELVYLDNDDRPDSVYYKKLSVLLLVELRKLKEDIEVIKGGNL